MRTRFVVGRVGLAATLSLAGCGAAPPAAPPAPGASADASSGEDPTGDAAPAGEEAKGADSEQPPAAPSLVERIEEDKLAGALGADYAGLLQLAKLSPKTHKSVASTLWKARAECPAQALVEIAAAPGLLVATPSLRVRKEVAEALKAAGALATQRGTSIEVVGAQQSIDDAVREYNRRLIAESIALAKAAPAADRKEKSFAGIARARLGESPHAWTRACEAGRTAGWVVTVQLVARNPDGGRGAVLVKGGANAERFTRESLEATYWNKETGRDFRTLTELMSAKFVRRCSDPSYFTASAVQDGSWRCKEEGESWDPPNRPLPPWQ